jgi:hypothetical protein
MKVDLPPLFIVAGMPRCGTTFLYHNFQKHPSIFCPFRKETNFFSTNFQRGVVWYGELFKGIGSGQIGVDVSPSYFLDKQSVTRIKELLPNAKVILGVRNPIDWSLSLYNQLISQLLKDRPTFEEFIESYAYPFGDQTIQVQLNNGYSIFALDLYRQTFKENLLLYQFDFFQKDPLTVLRAIESHVNLPPCYTAETFDNTIINAGNRKNISLLSYILSREKLISTIGSIFPRRLVQMVRVKYDQMSKRDSQPDRAMYSPENQRMARNIFAQEEEGFRRLFSGHPIIRGDGTFVSIS